jgi:hypothetical protein
VLGQPGHNQIAAGLAAADAMVDRIAGQRLPHRRPRPRVPGPTGDEIAKRLGSPTMHILGPSPTRKLHNRLHTHRTLLNCKST